MEHHDDDISILQGFDSNDDEVDGYFNVSNSCIPDNILPSTVPRSSTALFALQTAYSDLKNRYNEQTVKNLTLSRALRDVERRASKMTSPCNDANYPMSYNSQGAAAMADEPPAADSSDLGAQKGYMSYMRRELSSAQAQIKRFETVKASYNENLQKMQTKYKECVDEDSRKGNEIALLQQQLCVLETENRTVKDQLSDCRLQLDTCQHQLQEKETNISQGHDYESQMLARVRQMEEECARLRLDGEIARASMVQKDREVDDLQGKVAELEAESKSHAESMSLASIPANDELIQLKKIIAGLKDTVYQQNMFLRKFVKNSSLSDPTRSPTKRKAIVQNDELDFTHRDVTAPRLYGSSIMEDSPLLKVTLPPQAGQHTETVVSVSTARQHVPQGTRSEVFNRRPSPGTQAEHSKSEVILRTGGLNDLSSVEPYHDLWTEEHNLASSYDNAPAVQEMDPGVPQKPDNAGYFRKQQNGLGYELPQRQHVSRYVLPQSQNVAGYDLPQSKNVSGYDLPQIKNHSAYSVSQNRPSVDNDVTSSKGITSPSAADDRSQDAAAERHNSSHVCPVCSADFSHYSMDEFQTHVFECFDDSDGPETLHAEQTVNSTDRICPMCSAVFPETVPQQEFETHVQTHFEDGSATGFEVIEP